MRSDLVTSETDRLFALDGLRAVAVLLVVFHHYFYTLPQFYPYGGTFTKVPFFQYGYLGVYLFFIISGFVIALTLQSCERPRDFALKRFARIWPALVVCSTLTFVVGWLCSSPFSQMSPQQIPTFCPL
jgi:peptidoglycan/LPS O-acetylase OafA/YrhL